MKHHFLSGTPRTRNRLSMHFLACVGFFFLICSLHRCFHFLIFANSMTTQRIFVFVNVVKEISKKRKKNTTRNMLTRASSTNRLAFARSAAWCIPAPGKKSKTGEDGFYITRNGLSLGVADGVGGWAEQGVDPSIFTRKFMRFALQDAEALTAASATADNKKYTSGAIMHSAFDKVMQEKLLGSCAALFATLENNAPTAVPACATSESSPLSLTKRNKRLGDAPTGPFATLNVACIGDCGVAVVRAGMGVVFASREQQRSFNFPYQLGPEGDTPAAALLSDFCVAHGDIVILGSDGVFDNVYAEMLAPIVLNEWRKSVKDPKQKNVTIDSLPPLNCSAVAENIAKLAYQGGKDREHLSPFSLRAKMVNVAYEGGKPDDITVLVAQVLKVSDASTTTTAAAGDSVAEAKSVATLEPSPYSLIEDYFEANPVDKLMSKL